MTDEKRCTGCVVYEDEDGNLIPAVVIGCPVHDVADERQSDAGGDDAR